MPDRFFEEVPYGQRVADDCTHLIDNAAEMDVLLAIYEKLLAGWRPGAIAAELNARGYRNRGGFTWTSTAVFDLVPRLIELSPKLSKRPDWPSRRAKIQLIS